MKVDALVQIDKTRMLLQKVEDLPAIPATVLKILELAKSESSTAGDLAGVISQDPSVSSVMLKLVNSAFYGHFRDISSLKRAVIILGFQTAKTIALGASLFCSQSGARSQLLDRSALWSHSLGVATFAKLLAEHAKLPENIDGDTVFIAGLLHDLGKVAFDNILDQEYEDIVATAQAEEEWIRTIEERIIGINHAVAGAIITGKWQLPPAVVGAIKHHHDIDIALTSQNSLALLVHVADYTCHLDNLGASGNFKEPELDQRALDSLGLNNDLLDAVTEEMEESRKALEALSLE